MTFLTFQQGAGGVTQDRYSKTWSFIVSNDVYEDEGVPASRNVDFISQSQSPHGSSVPSTRFCLLQNCRQI